MFHKFVIGTNTFKPLYVWEQGSTNILDQWLDSLYRNTEMSDNDIAVIVVNNAEDPEMVRIVRETCEKFKIKGNLTLLEYGKNLGTSKAWNIIARYFECDFVGIFNDDTMCYPSWFGATKYILENNQEVGSVSYDLWYTKNPLNYPVPFDLKIWANECIYPLGAAFAFRREIFDKIGGFDENFWMAREEADFGIRLVKNGYFNYVIGTHDDKLRNDYHFVRHIGSASGGYVSNSGDIWKEKWERNGIPWPLNPEIEERLNRERGDKRRSEGRVERIELKLPWIKCGKCCW